MCLFAFKLQLSSMRGYGIALLLVMLGCSVSPLPQMEAAIPVPADAAYVALFRRAIALGSRAAYCEIPTDLLCVALRRERRPGDSWEDRFLDPDPAVVQQLRQSYAAVRPYSACEIEPLRPLQEGSLVVEPATGKRGLLLWVTQIQEVPGEPMKILVGYYQHGRSAGGWRCSLTRQDAEWVATDCQLERIL
jgi:hypothetical protein